MSPVNCSVPCQKDYPVLHSSHLLRSNWDDAPPATDESSRLCRRMSVEVTNTTLITLCRLVGPSSSNHASLAEGWAVNYGIVSYSGMLQRLSIKLALECFSQSSHRKVR
jgi:hypothetical protein